MSELLPPLVEALRDDGRRELWTCDPMHGNTFVASGGQKTRRFDDVIHETSQFFTVHQALGTWPGGLHVELTGDDVTECLGGGSRLNETDLELNYTTDLRPAPQRHPEPRYGLSRGRVPAALLHTDRREVVVAKQPSLAPRELDLASSRVLDARAQPHLPPSPGRASSPVR